MTPDPHDYHKNPANFTAQRNKAEGAGGSLAISGDCDEYKVNNWEWKCNGAGQPTIRPKLLPALLALATGAAARIRPRKPRRGNKYAHGTLRYYGWTQPANQRQQ